ncbi:unnamed protein product [Cyclocybe aegerita]|uniref:Uncharacterized protein n=1 Tax=Cyclocybe aegerita TaxID=1973307 RepID=A0A8S0VUD3_CYCAE|nr:unnamed protein product [Cyclocybe aegerita]
MSTPYTVLKQEQELEGESSTDGLLGEPSTVCHQCRCKERDGHDNPAGHIFRGRWSTIAVALLVLVATALSIMNAIHAAKAAKLLASCETKRIEDLPRPDPFIGLHGHPVK